MENASNALIMAGEILIAVLIISLFAYIVIQFGNYSSQMHDEMSESQVTSFNNNFTLYSNRTNITAQEIATIINFAKQANDDRELEWNDSSEYYITVYIDNKNVFNNNSYIKDRNDYNSNEAIDKVIRKFIKDNNTKYFGCNAFVQKQGSNIVQKNYDGDIYFNLETDLVNRIDFHTIDPTLKDIPSSV